MLSKFSSCCLSQTNNWNLLVSSICVLKQTQKQHSEERWNTWRLSYFFFSAREGLSLLLFLIGCYFSTEKRAEYLSFFLDKEWRWFLGGKILALESSSMRVTYVFPENIWRNNLSQGKIWPQKCLRNSEDAPTVYNFTDHHPTSSRCDAMENYFLAD